MREMNETKVCTQPFCMEWEIPSVARPLRPQRKFAVAGIRSKGIGQATVKRLMAAGNSVICCDLDNDGGLEAVAEIDPDGRFVSFVHADVSCESGVETFMDAIAKQPGNLLGVVCNAGAAGDPLADNLLTLSAKELHRLFADNVVSAHLVTQGALKRFLLLQPEGGSVLYVGSNNGQRGFGILGQTGYAIAKNGLSALMATAVARFGKRVRFNMVRCGVVRTESANWKRRLARAKDWAELEGSYTPMGRLGTPSDVANAIAWLLSDEANWVSGAELQVDGGVACGGLQFPAFDATNFRESYVEAVRTWAALRNQMAA